MGIALQKTILASKKTHKKGATLTKVNLALFSPFSALSPGQPLHKTIKQCNTPF
jgi:hypothetical protein